MSAYFFVLNISERSDAKILCGIPQELLSWVKFIQNPLFYFFFYAKLAYLSTDVITVSELELRFEMH